jgi:hypothetical protein
LLYHHETIAKACELRIPAPPTTKTTIWSTIAEKLKHWTNSTNIEVVTMDEEDTQVLSADEISEHIEKEAEEKARDEKSEEN